MLQSSTLSPRQRAFLESQLSEERLSRLRSVLNHRIDTITLVLDNLLDPHNMAAICRTSEALGITELYTIERDYELDVSHRVSRYSDKWLLIHRFTSMQDCVAALRDREFTILAAQMTDEAVPLDEMAIDSNSRIAVVLGNEHEGVHRNLLKAVDGSVVIPMAGFTESFNVSVAAALALQSLTGRLRQAIAPEPSTLSESKRAQLYDHWLRLSVKHSNRLLRALKD